MGTNGGSYSGSNILLDRQYTHALAAPETDGCIRSTVNRQEHNQIMSRACPAYTHTPIQIYMYIYICVYYRAITAFSASLGIRLGVRPPAQSLVGIPTSSVAAAASMATPTYTLPIVASTAEPLAYGPPSQTGPTLVPTRALSFPLASLTSQFFPLPETICAKIKNLEFVNMNELKPLAWQSNESEKSNPIFAKKRKSVTDILMWVQCFSTMAAVLAEHYPNKLPHLMAYLSTIMRCAHRYQRSHSLYFLECTRPCSDYSSSAAASNIHATAEAVTL